MISWAGPRQNVFRGARNINGFQGVSLYYCYGPPIPYKDIERVWIPPSVTSNISFWNSILTNSEQFKHWTTLDPELPAANSPEIEMSTVWILNPLILWTVFGFVTHFQQFINGLSTV